MAAEPALDTATHSGLAPLTLGAPSPARIDSVDLLRGLVMVLMVLDHTRDFFSGTTIDMANTTPGLFMTRWVTHFCAPVFAFLAGTGVSLAEARGAGRSALARFLVTRGLWLMILEQTVEKFGLTFHLAPVLLGLVLWSIGGSMVLLSIPVALGVSSRVVGVFGLILIAGHGLLNGLAPDDLGVFQPLRTLLLRPGLLGPTDGPWGFVGYPLLPWFGVVAAGYGFGAVFRWESARRRRAIVTLGLASIVAFVLIRLWNDVLCDPNPWSVRGDALSTALSFVNCTKYPPSLLYVLMTLGPALLLLGLVGDSPGAWAKPFVTLGRVPLFYYLIQWYVIHGLALLVAAWRGQSLYRLFPPFPLLQPPAESAYGLPVVYLVWLVVLGLLYAPCRWFAGLKQRRKDLRWLSYF